MPKLPFPPSPEAQPGAQAPGRGQRQDEPARHRRRGGDHRRRLGRRAHVAVGRRALADVPQGPQGDQLVLHAGHGDDVRLPQPGGHRRLPGHVLRPVAHPGLRVGALHHQRGLPRRVRARHAQVGLVGDGDPHLPAHGADLLLRRLQVPARAQLGHRRGAGHPHLRHGADGLPAALRPALAAGRRSWPTTSPPAARSSAPTSATSCAPGPSSARPRCRASTPSTCCWSRARSPR